MEKQKYYVSLNPTSLGEISSLKVNDGKLIEYEIEATPTEKMSFEKLLREVKAHDVELGSLFTFKHYFDKNRDKDKDEFQQGLNDIYKELHRLGTEETKQQIEEIDLMNHHH